MKCPHCGKDTIVSPEHALLLHIKQRRDVTQLHLNRRIEKGRPETTLKQKRKTLAKWQAWYDWVESKIKEAQK